MSSAQESSSIEREADSEEEAGVYGPNKRQDRRMSKATALLMKNKQEHRREMLAEMEQKDGSQLSIAESVNSQWEDISESLPTVKPAPQEDDDDSDWREASQGITDDERSSAPPPSQEDKERIKLKLNMSNGSTKVPAGGRTHARQLGPQRRRITAREKKDQRKQAQKNARKQRAQQDAAAKATKDLPIRPANVNTSFTESFRTIAI